MASSNNNYVSREEYRNKKALDELRKAGKMPAEVDEEGKEINPHMPQYLIQAPWYLNQSQPSLKHLKQRSDILRTKLEEWYPRGIKSDKIVTKYRKGACENCGANTHKLKDCFERPRNVGAKFTGKDLQQDEIIKDIELDYDAKRDRWNGYDPDMYTDVIKEYEQYDIEHKKQKQKELDNKDDAKEDEYKISDFEKQTSLQITQKDPKTKTTIRNLRIREDPAKYLFNLDENSAHYDPKTRAMREDPNPNSDKQIFRGDNAYRYTGDTLKLLEQEKFAWELIENNSAELNTVGLPSGTEDLFKKMKEKEKEKISEKMQELYDKYGEGNLLKVEEGLIFSQTENYIEYGRDGKLKSNFDKTRGKSKYEENKYINNHTTVWGSWWNEELGWGFSCCHSNEKQSLCIGERGKFLALKKEYLMKKKKEEDIKQTEETFLNDTPQDENKQIVIADEKNESGKKSNKDECKKIKKKIKCEDSDSGSDSSESSSSESKSESEDGISSRSSSSSSSSSSSNSSDSSLKKKKKYKNKKKIKKKQNPFVNDLDDCDNLDKKKLKKALKKEDEKLKKAEEMKDDRKRPYNSFKADCEVSKEELEAYRMKKMKIEDPLYAMKINKI